jgi:hypothetical protein
MVTSKDAKVRPMSSPHTNANLQVNKIYFNMKSQMSIHIFGIKIPRLFLTLLYLLLYIWLTGDILAGKLRCKCETSHTASYTEEVVVHSVDA